MTNNIAVPATAKHRSPVLFPLPLTPFEYYYWCDDRPDYPTTFPMELTFTGRLDRRHFTAALQTALARHPLLQALIDDTERIPAWISCQGQAPPLDWADEQVPIQHPDGETIDLKKNVGLRIWVRESEDTTRLLLQFHHACCDGMGALRLVEDLLIDYSRSFAGEEAQVDSPPMETERLRIRGEFGQASAGFFTALRDLWVTSYVWGKIVLLRPEALAAPRSALEHGQTPQPFLAFQSHLLDPELVSRLRQAAKSSGTTLNDVLLRDLFQVLRNWNAREGNGRNGWLRINMPTNLRDRLDRKMPAANVLGFAFLTRRANQCQDGRRLLESIHRETETIRRWKLGLYFLGGLAFACGVNGLVPRMLQQKRSFATAVLSNVGRVFASTPLPRHQRRLICGNVVLQQLTGVPPIRPLTRASVAVVNYAGQMTVNLRCDPHFFSIEQTRALLQEYVRQLETTGHEK